MQASVNPSRLINAAILPGLLLGAIGASRAAEASGNFFKGPDCKACHSRIRDQRPAIPDEASPSKEEYDVIVVGGGLSGLTAAYRLKDKRVLVLEKESRTGGKARRERWGGRRYPAAAAYLSEPYDAFAGLFKELGLKPKRVRPPTDALFHDGTFIPDFFQRDFERLPYPAQDRKAFAKLAQDAVVFLEKEENSVPPVPEKLTRRQRDLDKVTFHDHLLKRYGAEVARFGGHYSKSVFGVGAEEVSAFAGMLFLSSEYGPSVSWNGGPGAIAERLTAELKGRVVTGAFVSAVKAGKGGMLVAFESRGKKRYLRSKVVVMAVPSFVAKRILQGFPKRRRKLLDRVKYSAYAVAAVGARKRFKRPAYAVWTYDKVFTDIMFPDWISDRRVKGLRPPKQVLVAYIPLGTSRAKLFSEDPLLADKDISADGDVLTTRVVEDLEDVFPGIKDELHGVRLVRWGHAMPIPYPGYLSEVRAKLSKPWKGVFFAGVDTDLPAIEGAMAAGMRAAEEARALLSRRAAR